jgi:hypothetical protein
VCHWPLSYDFVVDVKVVDGVVVEDDMDNVVEFDQLDKMLV